MEDRQIEHSFKGTAVPGPAEMGDGIGNSSLRFMTSESLLVKEMETNPR
jgi:hypothetical protein